MSIKDPSAKIEALRELAFKLFYPTEEDGLIYMDTFCEMKSRALKLSNELFSVKGRDIEEEARLCVALLMGYNASLLREDNKIQAVLNRAYMIMNQLPSSLLKCQLLTYCYAEVFEPDMAREAHEIIDSWQGRELSLEERNVIMDLEAIEENPPHIEYLD